MRIPRPWSLPTLFALLAAFAWMPGALASEFSGRLTATSEYIYRGLAMSAGDPALQLGLDYAHDSGLFGGVWGSTIDLYVGAGKQNYEVDFYAGYHHEFHDSLSATATVIRYTYPGGSGSYDYDYNEFLLSTTFFERYTLEAGVRDEVYGYDKTGHHLELQAEWPIVSGWVLGATLGRNDLKYAGTSPYYYWDIGASARFARVIMDVRWFDNEEHYAFGTPQSAGSQFVLSLSYAF